MSTFRSLHARPWTCRAAPGFLPTLLPTRLVSPQATYKEVAALESELAALKREEAERDMILRDLGSQRDRWGDTRAVARGPPGRTVWAVGGWAHMA